jgi:integrase
MNTSFIASDGRRRNLFQKQRGGAWYFRVTHNGKNVWRSTETNECHVAKEKARKLFDEIVKGEVIDPDISFEQLTARFMAGRLTRAEKTRKNDLSFLKVVRNSFPKMQAPARQIRPGDLLAWLNAEAMAAKHRMGREWSGRTFNSYRLYFRQIFDQAVADRLIKRDDHPFDTRLVKRRREGRVVRKIPTPEQFAAIIADVRANHAGPLAAEFADLLEFCGLAGLGQAEVCALRKCDVVDQRIKVLRKKTGRFFDVPVYEWLAPLLARRCAMVQEPTARLFIQSEPGVPLRAACLRLGITHFSPRNLRAMLIKRLYDAGVPVKRIALWQGHTDGGRLIQQVYTEVFCDSDAAAEQADLARIGSGAIRVLPDAAVVA